MIAEFILGVLLLVIGIVVIVFAPQLGMWIYKFNVEIQKGFSVTNIGRIIFSGRFSWFALTLRLGPAVDIWTIRIIGFGFAGGALLLLGIAVGWVK